jgi:hypothetical protein
VGKSSGSSKPKKEREEKDENAPKRNMSAYFFFSNDERPKAMAADPTLTYFSAATVVSAKWAEVDEKTKAEYEEKARLDKERYLKEKAEYQGPSSSSKAKSSKEVKVKDENAPKRHCSAYFHFANEIRPKAMADDPTLTFFSVSKVVSAKWIAMTIEEKQKYEQIAADDKARYEKEFAEYQKSPEYAAFLSKIGLGKVPRAGTKRPSSKAFASGPKASKSCSWIQLEEFSDEDEEEEDAAAIEDQEIAAIEDEETNAIEDEEEGNEGEDVIEFDAASEAEGPDVIEFDEGEGEAAEPVDGMVKAVLDEEMEAEVRFPAEPAGKRRRVVDSDDE